MSECDLEDLPDLQELSGGPPGLLGVVGKFSRMCGSGRETLSDEQEWSGGPLR